MLTAEGLVERGNKMYGDHLTVTNADRGDALYNDLVPAFVKGMLDGIKDGSQTIRLFKVTSDDPLKIDPFDTSLNKQLQTLREGRKVTKGDQELFPSRPFLTALAISSVAARHARYLAHFYGQDPADQDRYAKFLAFSWVAQEAEAVGFSVARAEGVLKTSARHEAMAALGQSPSEVEIEKTAKRFQLYADKLVHDPTGISTVESDVALRVAPSLAGIETDLVIPGRQLFLTRTRLAAAVMGSEAYKLIYPQTEAIK